MLDFLIRDASIVDGTGAPPFPGSVGVEGGRITHVGAVEPDIEASRVIDASSLVLCPGFIDVHNHSDLSPLLLPEMPSTIRQGVTTVVVGNCGTSPWPLAGFDEAASLAYGKTGSLPRPGWSSYGDYLDALDACRPAVNVATLVGHGSIRREVMGLERRPPAPAELDRMRGLVADAIGAGSFGLSSGLIYVPGIFSETDEVVKLATAAATRGGVYASHIRGEGAHLFTALDEAFEIGRRAGLPVHISHLKCEGAALWGRAEELLARLRAADDATGDQYPYAAWNSSLSSLLPPWAPVTDIVRHAGDPRLREAVERGEAGFQSSVDGVGWNRIVIEDTAETRWQGMDVASIARSMGVGPFDAFIRLLIDDVETSCIGHAMDDADVTAILSEPEVFVASDASATAPDGPGGDLPVHPRDYGTFPRALALTRGQSVMPLEAMVRKMTSLPAERFGLRDRGRIAEGAFADLVLFDPATIADRATYEAPHVFPQGIETVIVNGLVAWEGDATVGRSGRALRRS